LQGLLKEMNEKNNAELTTNVIIYI